MSNVIFTLGSQRERRKFEKQPSQTIVSGAHAVSSSPFLALSCTPLIVPFTSSKDVTVPSSNRTLERKIQQNLEGMENKL